MTVAELNTVKTAYLRNELFKEICNCHHKVPNWWAVYDGNSFLRYAVFTVLSSATVIELSVDECVRVTQ